MSKRLYSTLSILAPWVAVLASCGAPQPMAPASQNPSPMRESVRMHERLPERDPGGTTVWIDSLLPRPVPVFIPDRVSGDDTVSVLIHFHGASFIPNTAAAAQADPTIAVTVHLGTGSSVYERPLADPQAFNMLRNAIAEVASGRAIVSEKASKLYLSAFSAGYGAVRAILRNDAGHVDGLLLLDGLHTDYDPPGKVLFEGGALGTEKLEPFVEFARSAMQGQVTCVITHSEIFPGTFASTTETTDYIIERLGLARRPVLEWGPVGMQLISRVDAGRLKILGFAGNTAPDHVDHFHALPTILTMLVDG